MYGALRSRSLADIHVDNRASLCATVEFLDAFLGKPYDSCDFRMECPIFSEIGVFPRSEFRAFLPHDNSSRVHALAGKEFDATSLALAIPNVTGRTTGFFVGHDYSIREVLPKNKLYGRKKFPIFKSQFPVNFQ
jgi:hypothetical protein